MCDRYSAHARAHHHHEGIKQNGDPSHAVSLGIAAEDVRRGRRDEVES
jgi:hypothetical protein